MTMDEIKDILTLDFQPRTSVDPERDAVQETDGPTVTVTLARQDGRLVKDKRQADPCKVYPPDVVLDAVAKVEEIKLDAEQLRANVALVAELSNLLKLSAGADVALSRVTLTITDVDAEAHLEVRLDQVRAILEAALKAITEHPEILGCEFDPMPDTVDKAVDKKAVDKAEVVVGGVLRDAAGESHAGAGGPVSSEGAGL